MRLHERNPNALVWKTEPKIPRTVGSVHPKHGTIMRPAHAPAAVQASRLGISTVISTDSIRHLLRRFVGAGVT